MAKNFFALDLGIVLGSLKKSYGHVFVIERPKIFYMYDEPSWIFFFAILKKSYNIFFGFIGLKFN